jgi:D-lactate dehydrogenase
MKIAFFSSHLFERDFLITSNQTYKYELVFFAESLNANTVALAQGFEIISCFSTDKLDKEVLNSLSKQGTKFISLRSAGFNHVDITAAKQYKLTVARVPAYSPFSVAEFAVGLILSLNRKIPWAYNRVRENDFSLNGLMGFDLNGKTVGIIGTGKIGQVFCKIMQGFGAKLLGNDPIENSKCLELGLTYVDLDKLLHESDIISLHCPLTPDTHHLIDDAALVKMKTGVMLINTGRGGLVNSKAVITALKTHKISALGIDVYEEEEGLFFHDLSTDIQQDDIFARLQTFPNVLITGHQAFLTNEALNNIAETTLKNVHEYESGKLNITLLT